MKISIITISFNQGAYIRRCIESVLSQGYSPLEYIIVDPGSTDGSRQIIEDYSSQISTILKSDLGPADGLNNGFLAATGDIFGFINADDYLLPGALHTVAKYFNCDDTRQFISGGGYVETPMRERFVITPNRMTVKGLLYNACIIFQQGTFFSSKLYYESGGFNRSNFTCWDMELFLKFLILGYRHEAIDARLGVFTIHPNSITGSGRHQKNYIEDRRRIFKEVMGRNWWLKDDVVSVGFRLAYRLGTYLVKL